MGKPSNASDMQAIKQNRCGKWCENAENNARHGKRGKERKTMQRGAENYAAEWETMQNAENRAKMRKTRQNTENDAKQGAKL